MGQAGGRWSSPASGESLHLPLRLGGPPGPRGEGAGTQVGATRAVALGRRGGVSLWAEFGLSSPRGARMSPVAEEGPRGGPRNSPSRLESFSCTG